MLEKRAYSDSEKERIFIEKIQRQNPFEWKYYLDLVSHEKMSSDELSDYNFRRRIETLKYAYENTVFYRRLYDACGLRPEDVKSETDWDAVPFVTKEDLRKHLSEMLVPGTEELRMLSTTSGSSGYPLKMFVDKPHYDAQSAEWRARGWVMGREKGQATGRAPVLGVNEGILTRTSGIGAITPKVASILNRLTYPMHRFFFDSMSLSLESMRSFMEEVQAGGGVYHLYGYVGTLHAFADAIVAGEMEQKMTPATITCAGSVMTESARQSIKTAFGITPHDLLGCNEIGRIGVECIGDEGALSVFSDIRHVDIVDSTGSAIHDSKDGVLLVTNFDTRVMPLIKYRLGDVTHFMAGSAQYGLPFPRIAQISGRETDYITDANGCKVFGQSAAFDDYPDAVFRHQWVVHGPGHVTLKCVLNRMNPDAEKEVRAVRDEWLARLAGRMDIALEFVEHIADEAGKIRFIIHE